MSADNEKNFFFLQKLRFKGEGGFAHNKKKGQFITLFK